MKTLRANYLKWYNEYKVLETKLEARDKTKKEAEKRHKRMKELGVDIGKASGANTKNELTARLGKAEKEF